MKSVNISPSPRPEPPWPGDNPKLPPEPVYHRPPSLPPSQGTVGNGQKPAPAPLPLDLPIDVHLNRPGGSLDGDSFSKCQGRVTTVLGIAGAVGGGLPGLFLGMAVGQMVGEIMCADPERYDKPKDASPPSPPDMGAPQEPVAPSPATNGGEDPSKNMSTPDDADNMCVADNEGTSNIGKDFDVTKAYQDALSAIYGQDASSHDEV